MVNGDFKDLARRNASDKIICNKVFQTASSLQYDRYQRGITLMVYKFFNKKLNDGGIKSEVTITQKLHGPIKIVNSIIDQWYHGWKVLTLKFIKHIMNSLWSWKYFKR